MFGTSSGPPREPYRTIAHISSDFPSKFGVPRQSGLVPELEARITFEPAFRSVDAVRGLDGFSHLWLIWEFNKSTTRRWMPTVRPPRLRGGRLGVWATRAPIRPNPIGLSSVTVLEVDTTSPQAPTLVVGGADLVDGTPILDIKPYVPGDCHPDASFGFIASHPEPIVDVVIADELLAQVPPERQQALLGVLRTDPRPVHMHDPRRVFGLPFAGLDVRFTFDGTQLVVHSIEPLGAHADEGWPGY